MCQRCPSTEFFYTNKIFSGPVSLKVYRFTYVYFVVVNKPCPNLWESRVSPWRSRGSET
ncbi:protein of unknown function [Pararobbsia alpina]